MWFNRRILFFWLGTWKIWLHFEWSKVVGSIRTIIQTIFKKYSNWWNYLVNSRFKMLFYNRELMNWMTFQKKKKKIKPSEYASFNNVYLDKVKSLLGKKVSDQSFITTSKDWRWRSIGPTSTSTSTSINQFHYINEFRILVFRNKWWKNVSHESFFSNLSFGFSNWSLVERAFYTMKTWNFFFFVCESLVPFVAGW